MTILDDLTGWQAITDSLPGSDRPAFARLGRELQAYAGRWGFFVLEYAHAGTRSRIAAAIEQAIPTAKRIMADSAQHPDWPALERAVAAAAAAGAGCVQIFALESWLDPLAEAVTKPRLRGLNRRREAFAQAVNVPVLLWLRAAQLRELAVTAPDLWSWRAGLHLFTDAEPAQPRTAGGAMPEPRPDGIDNRSAAERQARIDDLRAYLDHAPLENQALELLLTRELARLLASLGEYDAATNLHETRSIPLATALPDQRELVRVLLEYCRILHLQGSYDRALNCLRDKVTPLCDAVKDEGAKAEALGRIADILHVRGDLDEARRILEQEVLPVFERLGDIRAAAVARGRIADILSARGDLDEALRIREQEELPVYERLGDIRSAAITRGQIADILSARGDLDEALRIREQEELPVYERLGDIRSAVITRGQIADILSARGDLDEALRIREQEELPVYERLGDIRAAAVTRGQIADILSARGDLDEALRIREQEVLPVYERLGDIHWAAVTRGKIAAILSARGDMEAALDHYRTSLTLAEQLKDPFLTALYRLGCAWAGRAEDGNNDAYAAALAASFTAFRDWGRADWVAWTGLEYGQFLIDQGDHPQAAVILAEAAAAAQKIGNHERLKAIRALQAQCPPAPP